MTGTDSYEYRVACMDALQPVHLHVFDGASIHRGNLDGAPVGIENLDVPELEVFESSEGVSAEFDSVRAAPAGAVLDQHVFAHSPRLVALEAESIVRGIYVGIPDDDVAAVHHVQPIVVPIVLGIHRYAIYEQIRALVVLLSPAS